MRRAALRKLNNERGASVVVALLFFAICAVGGLMILTAGTASSGRLKSYKETTQSYYNVSSALRIANDDLSGQELTYDGTSFPEAPAHYTAFLESGVAAIQSGQASYAETVTITLPGGETLSDGSITMNSDYSLTYMVADGDSFKMTLTVPATLYHVSEDKIQVIWSPGTIVKS